MKHKEKSTKSSGVLVFLILACVAAGLTISLWNYSRTKTAVAPKLSCVESGSSENIYLKGNVTFTNATGVTTTRFDQCMGKTQVGKGWCYETPEGSGNMVNGLKVSTCPNGCQDGACLP